MQSAIAPHEAALPPEALLSGIDRGIEVHLSWTQRLLRCALLRESPGDDMLGPDAHDHCQFGHWLGKNRAQLQGFDAGLVDNIDQAHLQMHEAVRLLCEQVLGGRLASEPDLRAYEQAQSRMVGQLNALRERIADAAMQWDVLTGLPLRHNLEYTFGLRRKDAMRDGAQLWLAMIDVDRFKRVNDQHGHATGDIALRHVAQRLAGCMRESDALFRFGGEEFLALLLVREPQDIERLATRMLDAVREVPLTCPSGAVLRLSVTVGMAKVGAGETLGSATDRADRAMLRGKADGRNRYKLAAD